LVFRYEKLRIVVGYRDIRTRDTEIEVRRGNKEMLAEGGVAGFESGLETE
jgi:hypothetical protein